MNENQQVKRGDRITLHFIGKNEADEIFASTKDEQPVELTVGEGKVIPGIERGVLGMEVGERRSLTVSPEKGFGEWRPELVTTVKKEDFPESIQPSVGQQLRIKTEADKLTSARVTRIEADNVTLDANHPLAGQNLKFEIDLLEIN